MRARHTALVFACLAVLAAGTCPAPEGKPVLALSTNAASQAKSDKPLPEVFVSVLPEIKTKSHVPVLLPTELPKPIRKAKHALVDKAATNEYALSLYFELGIGDAGFAAYFSGEATPNYSPRELGNISEVKLAKGIRGYFRPVNCGGSCAPVNLWWEAGGVVYQIQLKLPYSLDQEDQQMKAITEVADSAILAGPR